MDIKEIYIDMDGVLCAFHKRYQSLFGSEGMEDYPAPSKNKIKEGYRKHFKEFIDTRQFASLEILPDVREGLEYIDSFQSLGIDIRILSSTAREEYWDSISSQKFEWLKEYGIDYVPIFVPGKRYKSRYSGPGKVLIDDTLSVIERWREEGGIGIHHSSWDKTISELKEVL